MSTIVNINPTSTKYKIMENTIKLIKNSSNSEVTIADICTATGITKSTFYYHFRSVDEIIEYFLRDLGQTVQDSMPQILMQETTFKQILSLFLLIDERIVDAGPAISAYRYSYLLKKKILFYFPKQEPTWDIIVTLIQKAQTAGEILNTRPPEEVAMACFYLSRGICTTWAMEGGNFDFKSRVREQLSALLLPAKGYEV